MDCDFRIHGCKCSGCDVHISPNELVMKALQNVYHVDCFKCFECGDKLEKGDEFILKENKLYCSADFNIADPKFDVGEVFDSDEFDSMSTISGAASPSNNSNNDKLRNTSNDNSKRPRTILTSQQREDFKEAFELTPKPCRKVREQLSNETGLSVRVVQVWFQNQRAKLKKIQKKSDGTTAVVTTPEKIKKTINGKVTKKKRSKSVSSIKSESSSGSSTTELNNNNNNNNNNIISSLNIKQETDQRSPFDALLDGYTDVQQMLVDSSSPKKSNENNNNNNSSIINNNNTITVHTHNNSLLSCGNSDASNSSSISNSPNNIYNNNNNNIYNRSNNNTRFEHQLANEFGQIKPLVNPFTRLSNDLLLQTTTDASFGSSLNNTFPIVTSNNNNNIASMNSAQFQMMPHLTNSFA